MYTVNTIDLHGAFANGFTSTVGIKSEHIYSFQLCIIHFLSLSDDTERYTIFFSIFFSNNHFSLIAILSIKTMCMDVEKNPGPLRSLDIACLNIRSVRKKLDVIEAELNNKDIICLTESHLNDTVIDSDLCLEHFSSKLLRKDRHLRPGGGILRYHKENVIVKRRDDFETNDLEVLWTEIVFGNSKVILGCIYRPPDSNIDYWNKLDTMLDHVTDDSKHTNADIILSLVISM